MNPSESTRLGSFVFTSTGVGLDLDGQAVWIKKESDPGSVAALQTFYRMALRDYEARHRAEAKQGWFSRLRSWIGRLIGGPDGNDGSRGHRERVANGSRDRAASADEGAGGAAYREPASNAEPRIRGDPATPPLLAPRPEAEPVLRAVFADRGGVHLVWRDANATRQSTDKEVICPLDSRVAESLQSCYGNLARLGFKVVGLDLRPSAAATINPMIGPNFGPSPTPSMAPSAGIAVAAPDKSIAGEEPALGQKAPAPDPLPVKPPEAREPTLVMRLNPEVPEQPNRALVSPVDSKDNLQILVAPERLLRTLRAASDPERPIENRLTYLRCAMGKNGLKVVEVGLGEGKENHPARWAEVAPWAAEQMEKAVGPRRPPSASARGFPPPQVPTSPAGTEAVAVSKPRPPAAESATPELNLQV